MLRRAIALATKLSLIHDAERRQETSRMIEADEKFFRTSFKGSKGWQWGQPPQNRLARTYGARSGGGLGDEQVPVLTAPDRSGAICHDRLPDTKWASIAGKWSLGATST